MSPHPREPFSFYKFRVRKRPSQPPLTFAPHVRQEVHKGHLSVPPGALFPLAQDLHLPSRHLLPCTHTHHSRHSSSSLDLWALFLVILNVSKSQGWFCPLRNPSACTLGEADGRG